MWSEENDPADLRQGACFAGGSNTGPSWHNPDVSFIAQTRLAEQNGSKFQVTRLFSHSSLTCTTRQRLQMTMGVTAPVEHNGIMEAPLCLFETRLDESQRIRMEERDRNKQRIKELYEEDDAEVWF